ncbi:Vanillyl-alcohol oxidase [Mycena venus]|uniref:Vanillyl-alcohol oxidase n=1 Tax=Mycena venus TaxID=2733690 RepID=A0A8H6X377_9AGAR|nr:Vanillyl-alcohol oxidase [Mycena venus]
MERRRCCVHPDPDVAGIGMTASFLATTALTGFCSSLALGFTLSASENTIDKWVASKAGWVFVTIPHFVTGKSRDAILGEYQQLRERYITPILYAMISNLADTQLITGLAFLICAFARMPSGLDPYHFAIVSDVANLSSTTQLIAVSTLLRCAETAKQSDDRAKPDIQAYVFFWSKFVRTLAMLATFCLLLITSTFQAHRDYWDCLGQPVLNLVSNYTFGTQSDIIGWTIYGYITLFWSYGFAMILMYRPLDALYRAIMSKICPPFQQLVPETFRGFLGPLKTFYYSESFDTYFASLAWISYGVYQLLQDRSFGATALCRRDSDTEAEWGFGQLIPMVLLVLPFLVALDAFGKALDGQQDYREALPLHSYPASPSFLSHGQSLAASPGSLSRQFSLSSLPPPSSISVSPSPSISLPQLSSPTTDVNSMASTTAVELSEEALPDTAPPSSSEAIDRGPINTGLPEKAPTDTISPPSREAVDGSPVNVGLSEEALPNNTPPPTSEFVGNEEASFNEPQDHTNTRVKQNSSMPGPQMRRTFSSDPHDEHN